MYGVRFVVFIFSPLLTQRHMKKKRKEEGKWCAMFEVNLWHHWIYGELPLQGARWLSKNWICTPCAESELKHKWWYKCKWISWPNSRPNQIKEILARRKKNTNEINAFSHPNQYLWSPGQFFPLRNVFLF